MNRLKDYIYAIWEFEVVMTIVLNAEHVYRTKSVNRHYSFESVLHETLEDTRLNYDWPLVKGARQTKLSFPLSPFIVLLSCFLSIYFPLYFFARLQGVIS